MTAAPPGGQTGAGEPRGDPGPSASPEGGLQALGTASGLPPHGPQVLPCTPDAAEAPAQPAGPPQPSDHSYALLDVGALKKKLFVTLKENEKLRKRLQAQRLVLRRLCRLRARGAGRPGPRADPRPQQRS